MGILKKYFVSSWVLLHELKASVNDSSAGEEIRGKYSEALSVYSFPVECIVQFSNGSVIHHENLNSILFPENQEEAQKKFEGDGSNHIKFGSISNYRYAQFLTRGLEKAGVQHDTQVTV